ncbi:hypothetical protein pdul_cds_637 [Pandoravirus dulcis]|uniref:DUF5865 domain-containing protein n=1 Tax=Pandoravirus dulcis TaxID=1349409 RepID=S4VY02_9VIRU|nr:hypothetical protein pdul_cds_637 [Pandoravirus dulcis]AGO82774.1 hypothetical protein pdul_cds_637 [Pandoravirus dulcis]
MSDTATTPQTNTTAASQRMVDVAGLVATLQEAVAALKTPVPCAAAPELAPTPAALAAPVESLAVKAKVAPAFTARGTHRAGPRALSHAQGIAGHAWNTGLGHMTVAQCAARVGALPAETLVATGSRITGKMLRVYAEHHRDASMANYTGPDARRRSAAVVSTAPYLNYDGTPKVVINAIELGGGPIEAERLARKLAKYAHDAPDAVVLVADGLAWLPVTAPAPGAHVAVVPSCPLAEIEETPLGPYGHSGHHFARLDAVVAKAKSMLGPTGDRSALGSIASYLASAMADGGLAAVDLFYVPYATSRAAVVSGAQKGDRGHLLTLAEFQAAHGGRTVTDGHIERFYRPIVPSDPQVVFNPMGRVLLANVDNVSDLYTLLDDPANAC